MASIRQVKEVMAQVSSVVIGKEEVIQKIMAAILAGGHILIEDIPGVGKTTMAMAFAKAMDLEQKRLQFTPDVMPSDVTGYYMPDLSGEKPRYVKGPVMCELFLADEINRTSPKTQSALLEVMEERQITLDGHTIKVPDPFTVIATQNPTGSSGTQPLPDSQTDRFMICLHMGYPDAEDEIRILKQRLQGQPLEEVAAVMEKADLLALQEVTQQIHISDSVYRYLMKLIEKTRCHELLRQGISPRGSLALARMAQGMALLEGRDYVIPDDIAKVFPDVAIHRIQPNAKAKAAGISAGDILAGILDKTEPPRAWKPEDKRRQPLARRRR